MVRHDGMVIVFGWVAAVALLAVLIRLSVLWAEPRVAFRPRRAPTPAPAPYRRFVMTTSDGVGLAGWQGPITPGQPVFLYICGNAGNLADRTDLLLAAAANGMGVVAFNYRGTGESEGQPTEQGVYRDAEAVYAYVTDTLGIPGGQVIAWGHSIGGAVATELALRRPCAGIILEASFRSAATMARRLFFGLPIDWAMSYRFDNVGNLKQLRCPVLLIHGGQDSTVPVEDAPALLDAALGPKELWLIPEGDHNDLYELVGPGFFERISSFAYRVTGLTR